MKIYMVWDHSDYYGPDLEGVFDSRKKAKDFMRGHENEHMLEIGEWIVNKGELI